MAGGTTDRPCEADCCHRTLFRVIGSRVHHLIQDPKADIVMVQNLLFTTLCSVERPRPQNVCLPLTHYFTRPPVLL
jgi:hypothetical protein